MIHLFRPPQSYGPEDIGLFYNYNAKAYISSPLAPAGYHIASASDWSNLYNFYGGQAAAGGALKDVNPLYWRRPNSYATNESGLSMRGAGFRDYTSGKFLSLGMECFYWTSAPSTGSFSLMYTSNSVGINGTTSIIMGFSVIIVKNDATDLGSVTDYDGNVYPTVLINGLVWATRNLRVLHFNDGTPIPKAYSSADWLAAPGPMVSAFQDKW